MVLTRTHVLFTVFLLGGLDIALQPVAHELVYPIPCEPKNSDCKDSLETIAADLPVTEEVDVLINIEEHQIYLNQNVTFSRLKTLTVNGHPDSTTTINCSMSLDEAGITIDNVRNLTLNDLTIISCGSLFLVNTHTYSATLTLKNCNNVNIYNLVISSSEGIGLMIYQHWSGRVHIAKSNFTDNELSGKQDKVRGGGGVYIGKFLDNSNHSIAFEFEQCHFKRNVAHTKYYQEFYTDEFGERRSGNGHGGGACVSLVSDIIHSYVEVLFSNCTFTENRAFLGGGLSIKIGRKNTLSAITKITITVENSEFTSNECNCDNTVTGIGGGVHLSDNLVKSSKASGREYRFRNVKFIRNSAELGGGVFVFSYRTNSGDNSLQFDNCTFENNEAHIGSAVDLVPSSFVTISDRHTIVPMFRNCLFLENEVRVHHLDSNKTQSTAGIGTVYASHYDIQFQGENCFENNHGTALYMVNGMANFTNSDVNFSCNRGINGGAIALTGTSVMVVGPQREYVFINNTALYQGGALFVMMTNHHDFTISKDCFIQFYNGTHYLLTRFNNTISFTGNSAPVGRAIFATSLHPCQFISDTSADIVPYIIPLNASETFACRGINITNEDIATEGALLHPQQDTLHMIPGRQDKHNVIIKDDMNNIVKEPLRATIVGNICYPGSEKPLYIGQTIQVSGKRMGKGNLSLQTVSTRQSSITLKVELEQCPPGFKLEGNKCKCNFIEHYGLLKCDDDFHSLLTPGLWAGIVKDETSDKQELATSVCPRSFCNYNNILTDKDSNVSVIKLPWNSSDLQRIICGEKRMGILCGECAPDYTTYYHSPDLQCNIVIYTLCKAGWFFYFLTELVPVTVVLITVLAFDINFTSGAVNGFILFSQVLLSLNIDASGIITFHQKRAVTEGYQFLYGFLNLDFFTTDTLSFCLWPKASALDMLAFKYITIVYALSLVVLVIWFMNKCGGRFLGKWCRITTVKSSVIHGISAFFIICYSQSIMVSTSLLNSVELWKRVNSKITISKRVWHNGELHYLYKEHLLYALPALLCLLTIGVLPPILLLAYPLINNVLAYFGLEESTVVRFISQKLPIDSLKPLLDSFQGCFKDNLRFFAGLYFLYRWLAPIVNATTSSLYTTYITSEVLLILILALHALFQPYQKRVHNIVDTLLFTNLLLINGITCVNFHLFLSQENRSNVKDKVTKTAAIQMILIYLPITIMLFYLLVVGSKRMLHFWNENKATFSEDINLPATHKMRRLKAAVRSISSTGGNVIDNELPHRLIASEVSYKCFEDDVYDQETYAEAKSVEDFTTY